MSEEEVLQQFEDIQVVRPLTKPEEAYLRAYKKRMEI